MTSTCDAHRPAREAAACDACLARTWLIGALAGHLEPVRSRILPLLGLGDQELIAAVAGRRGTELRRRLEAVDPELERRRAEEAGLQLLCRCNPRYPTRLRALAAPPAVLHVAGDMDTLSGATATAGATAAAAETATETETVAVVGSRRASPYGLSVARSLARALAAAGIQVVSGMACGVDAAAHRGALEVVDRRGARKTLAVLPAGLERPYPRSNRKLPRELRRDGAVISELPPEVVARSWMFRARNRIIAAIAAMTVVVEAGERSGSLVTAGFARDLGREVGAVPGRVTSALAAGPNALIRDGAHLVRGAQDVLDVLFEAGVRLAPLDERPELDDEQRALLGAIGDGHDTAAALARRGILPEQGLTVLASLELAGYIQRAAGGRFAIVP